MSSTGRSACQQMEARLLCTRNTSGLPRRATHEAMTGLPRSALTRFACLANGAHHHLTKMDGEMAPRCPLLTRAALIINCSSPHGGRKMA